MEDRHKGKIAAATTAVDKHVKNSQVLGIGSGSTIVYVIEEIAKREKEGGFLDVICIPASFQAKQLIIENGLTLGTLDKNPQIDITFDGADEVDENLTCIKGGGACLTQEKIVASCANEFYIVADSSKQVKKLGTSWKQGIPVEVIPSAYKPIQLKLELILGGKANLGMASNKCGPLVTDNGNFILDWEFPSVHKDWTEINQKIMMIPGVLDTGLFINMADKAYFGKEDGTVIEQVRKK